MSESKEKLARALTVGMSIYMPDGTTAKIEDIIPVKQKGSPSKWSDLVGIVANLTSGPNKGKKVDLVTFSTEKIKVVPKKIKKSIFNRFWAWWAG